MIVEEAAGIRSRARTPSRSGPKGTPVSTGYRVPGPPPGAAGPATRTGHPSPGRGFPSAGRPPSRWAPPHGPPPGAYTRENPARSRHTAGRRRPWPGSRTAGYPAPPAGRKTGRPPPFAEGRPDSRCRWRPGSRSGFSSGGRWAAAGPDRPRLMKPGNMVWVLSTAVGTMAHSTAMAEITGSATVREQRPRQEMSWILAMRFIKGPSVRTVPPQCSTSGGSGQEKPADAKASAAGYAGGYSIFSAAQR